MPDLWHDPNGLYDALALSIMDPLVVLTEQMLGVYGRLEYELNRIGVPMPKLYVVPFDVPELGRNSRLGLELLQRPDALGHR